MNDLFLFLPDFIGHPLCFKTIMPIISKKSMSAKFVSYHMLEAYENISMLAENIFINYEKEFGCKKIYLMGYSFGGIVAFELAKLLSTKGILYELTLIDTHLIERGLSTEKNIPLLRLEDVFEKFESLKFIQSLIQLREVSQAVVEKNLMLFERYLPDTILEEANLFISNQAWRYGTSSSEAWGKYIRKLSITLINSTHWEMMRHISIKNFIEGLL